MPLERTSGTVTVRPVGKILIDKVVKIRPTSIMEFSMTKNAGKFPDLWPKRSFSEACSKRRTVLNCQQSQIFFFFFYFFPQGKRIKELFVKPKKMF